MGTRCPDRSRVPPFPPPVSGGLLPEFADLAAGRDLPPPPPQLGGARQANERVPRRARLLLHALIGLATLEAGREWEWRAPPAAARRVPPAALAPSFSCAPGSGRARAALRIAHAGGAAVFVGWGSGLPLTAGTLATRVSGGEGRSGGEEAQKEALGVGDLACHSGRDCPAGLESRLQSTVASGLLSAAGRSGVRPARDGEGCKRQELPSSRLGKLPGLRAASRACTRNSRWSEFPGSGLAAPHVLLPGFALPG